MRVPRENLLDRFASVDRAGQYRSPYSASRRFAATLGELTGGRVGLTCSSLAVLKVRRRCPCNAAPRPRARPATRGRGAAQGAVTIAVRYSAARQQFGPPDAPEISVLDYTSQQEKLMPMLATAYALHFATRYLVAQYAEAKRTKEEEIVADVHALSAGAAGIIENTCLVDTESHLRQTPRGPPPPCACAGGPSCVHERARRALAHGAPQRAAVSSRRAGPAAPEEPAPAAQLARAARRPEGVRDQLHR